MPKAFTLVALLATFALAGHHRGPVVTIEHMGFIECFAPEELDARGRPLGCETSAVQAFGDRLLIASDKEAPAGEPSQVMWLRLTKSWPLVIAAAEVQHENNGVLTHARKLEAMAVSAEGDLGFATSDFDYPPDRNAPQLDAYNTLVYWPIRDITRAAVANPTSNGGVTSSVSLRAAFAAALTSEGYPGGPPYFKIEGLTALPHRTLLFGVREIGPDYPHHRLVFTVLKATYSVSSKGEVAVASPLTVLATIDPAASLPASAGHAGLSSIERDGDRLWFLTTIEAAEGSTGSEAFLWLATLADGEMSAPSLVNGPGGTPVRLPCKAEGLTVLPGSRLFVVCDEDRAPTRILRQGAPDLVRRPGEGVYLVLSVHGR